jgi:3-oxoacyl-[acyl-carrier protein] reductase
MRHVIVTGGTRGLGLELVTAFLEAGYKVSTCGRKDSPELQLLAGKYHWALFSAQCYVDKEEDVDRFFR